ARIHRAELERPGAGQPALQLRRQAVEDLRRRYWRRVEVLRLRHFGHGQLVLHAGLGLLEAGREVEDRLTVLDRHHPAHRETAAIARTVDVVDDRMLDIAGAQ